MLVGDGPDEEWVIRAPNLRNLALVDAFPYGGRTESLPRLEDGVLFGLNHAKFLTGMARVTKLNFYCNSILGWSKGTQENEANDEFLNAQCVKV